MKKEKDIDLSVNLFLDSISVPLALCNQEYKLVYGNHALVEIFGKVENHDLFSFLSIPETDQKPFPLLTSEGEEELLFSWVPGPFSAPFEIRQKRIRHPLSGSLILIEFKKIQYEKDMLTSKVQQIDRQERILEYIFTHTHLMIAFLDTDLTILSANEALVGVSGLQSAELEGKTLQEIFPEIRLDPESLEFLNTGKALEKHNQKMTLGNPSAPSGQYWDWSLQSVMEKDRVVNGFILVMTNVSRRVESVKQLAMAREKLDNSKRLSDIGTLAATVAHELRNPLGVMAAAIFNISRKSTEKNIRNHINSIDKKIRESQQTINNLLNYARIKEPVFKKIHIIHLIRECIDDAQKRFRNSKTGIVHDYEDLSDLRISIDPFQIREVISNIINNALQATAESDPGRIKITGIITDKDMELTIKDNGPGIKPEDVDDIFRPFFTLKPKGTGLGLTICRDLLLMHKGTIVVKSSSPSGTVMSIRLPLKRDLTEKPE